MHTTQPHRVQTCDAPGSEQALGYLSLRPRPLKRFNLKKTCIDVGTRRPGCSELPCGVPPTEGHEPGRSNTALLAKPVGPVWAPRPTRPRFRPQPPRQPMTARHALFWNRSDGPGPTEPEGQDARH